MAPTWPITGPFSWAITTPLARATHCLRPPPRPLRRSGKGNHIQREHGFSFSAVSTPCSKRNCGFSRISMGCLTTPISTSDSNPRTHRHWPISTNRWKSRGFTTHSKKCWKSIETMPTLKSRPISSWESNYPAATCHHCSIYWPAHRKTEAARAPYICHP